MPPNLAKVEEDPMPTERREVGYVSALNTYTTAKEAGKNNQESVGFFWDNDMLECSEIPVMQNFPAMARVMIGHPSDGTA